MDEYLVPTQFGEDEFIEKKSRFIGRCWPVETEEEALEKIAAMKKQHTMHLTTAGRILSGTAACAFPMTVSPAAPQATP